MTTNAPRDWMDWRNDLPLITNLLPERLRNVDVEEWAGRITAKPFTNTMAVLVISAVAFYKAEKGHNPKVNDVWDAFVYCSTCLSVGYGDIFARTTTGKIIGTTLMTIGPALTNAALKGPAQPEPASDATQQQMLQTLQKILGELERMNATQNPASPR